jgi:hypothetical protein
MPEDIKGQLLTRIKCSPKFALQIIESTDVAGLLLLFAFVRYCYEENIEEFMFCLLLTEREVMCSKAVNDYCIPLQKIFFGQTVL